MNKIKMLLLCALVSLITTPAYAGDKAVFFETGGGVSDVDSFDKDRHLAVAVANLGYQTSPYFNWDVSLYRFENDDTTAVFDTMRVKTKWEGRILALAGRFTLPVNKRLKVYGKAGIGTGTEEYRQKTYSGNVLMSSSKVSTTKGVALLGVGANAFLTEHVALGLSAVVFPGRGNVNDKYLGLMTASYYF